MSSIFEAVGTFIDAIKINGITQQERDSRIFWIKERRLWSRGLAALANRFFRLAGNPVQVRSGLREWQRGEVFAYDLLHGGEGFSVFAQGERSVWAEQLPGVSLDSHAFGGTLEPGMVEAAARELRRAHALPISPREGEELWSHGDPHLGNFLYDAREDRARLIDFEVSHDPALTQEQRQADDLLVVLQDLMGRGDDRLWTRCATAFLRAYSEAGEAPIRRAPLFERLRQRLRLRGGVSRLWWGIRTGYLPRRELVRRINTLLALLEDFPQRSRAVAPENRVPAALHEESGSEYGAVPGS